MLQKKNPTGTGNFSKYEPLEAREFVDFTNSSSLMLKNVEDHSTIWIMRYLV